MNFKILFAVLGTFFGIISCVERPKNQHVIPIEDFFIKPERTSFKISPDGRKIAYLGVHDHCKNIFILDLVNPDSSKQLTYQESFNVQGFFWLDDQRIIFSNTQSSSDSLRLFHVEVSTDKILPLLAPIDAKLRWVYPIVNKKGSLVVALNQRDSSLFDLHRIYLDGRKMEMLYENPGNVVQWIGAPDGKVPLALTSDSVQEALLYRASEDVPFKEVMRNDFETTFIPLGFVKDSANHIYALYNQDRDRLALVEFDAKKGVESRKIHENQLGDLTPGGYLQESQQMAYTSSFVNKNEKFIFNASFQDVYQFLKTKFPDTEVDFLDQDDSLEGFIIRLYSDIHPGEIYYVNRITKSVQLLSQDNPNLREAHFNKMEEVKFLSRDNKDIYAYLTYPNQEKKNVPVVVLVHDGPNRRSEWGFDPEVQFLTSRGYAVFQVNYRGSIGYGKDFWAAGFKEWGGKIQSDISDGVAWLIHQGIADKDKIAIMGSGFGGYSALYAAAFNPSLFTCAISTSGYSNLFTYFREIPAHLKHYVQLYYRIIGNPEKESELFQSISPVFHADKVRIPVLFFQGGRDKYSSVTDANQFVSKLRNNQIPVRYVFKKDEGKKFRNEENVVEYYQEIQAFLAKYLN